MSHLHDLLIKPQIYVDLLEGDTESPYYLYVGATEDYIRRYTQKIQGYDAYHSGDNNGWCTPLFCRHQTRTELTVCCPGTLVLSYLSIAYVSRVVSCPTAASEYVRCKFVVGTVRCGVSALNLC
eukprot:COSAG01_NODE_451_length_16883_cov_55.881733_8_plen_124_part_00